MVPLRPGLTADGPAPARIRAATQADLPRCAEIWRDAMNDYLGRLNQPEIPSQLETIGRLHAHLLATDPARFVVAVAAALPATSRGRPGAVLRSEPPSADIVGFASAYARGTTWYLSMLFVEPAAQGGGIGRALLEAVLPPPAARDDASLALSSDSAQPVSNGLYASFGLVPRLPVYHLVGRPVRAYALAPFPPGISATSVDAPPDVAAEIDELDRETLGFDHPQDHAFALATGRRPFAYRNVVGRLLAYGYASPVGHIGPIAVRDPALLAAVLGHLLAAVEPRGASAVWVPGAAGEAFAALVRAGLRLDGFPVLLCWSRPFADFARYVPQSPGLL